MLPGIGTTVGLDLDKRGDVGTIEEEIVELDDGARIHSVAKIFSINSTLYALL